MEQLSTKEQIIMLAATGIYVAALNSDRCGNTDRLVTDAVRAAYQVYEKMTCGIEVVRKERETESFFLHDVSVSMRLVNTARSNGIKTLGDLSSLTKSEFLNMPHVGMKTVVRAENLLNKYGLTFRDTPKVK